MSLILTSNTTANDSGNSPNNSGLNLPYSYHNYLSNALQLPADSEVAVQSVKINKEGSITVNRANNQYYIYIGDTQEDSAPNGNTIEWTTSTPFHTYISNNQMAPRSVNMGTNQLAEEIAASMNRGVFHPNLLKSDINTSGCQCNPRRNASNLTYTGWDIMFNISTNNATDQKAIAEFEHALNAPRYQAGVWDDSLFTITNTATAEQDMCEMIGTGVPISQTNGTFKVSYAEAGGLWQVGLTRFLDTETETYAQQNPQYSAYQDRTHFDWVCRSEWDASASKYYLHVYHYCRTNDTCDLVEFDYTGVVALIETFDQSASYSAGTISEIEWTVSNEQITLYVVSDNEMTKYTLANGQNAVKIENLKPTCSTTKFLYPKVRMRDNGAIMKILEYKGVNITDFVYGDNRQRPDWNRTIDPDLTPNDMDWWCKIMMADQDMEYGWPIDSRYMFDMDDDDDGPDGDGTYTQLALNASGGINASIVMILKEDISIGDHYAFTPTPGANAQALLGFKNIPILSIPSTSIEAGNKISYLSAETPIMVSTNSVFVRLDNYSQLSFNAQTGSPSKILYHLPRFTNSGEEFGGLYFEPTERTYVKLNNPNVISINDFSLSLCNPDETLSTNLTGKTIIMLHFRKSLN
jgi:hypothetical protein